MSLLGLDIGTTGTKAIVFDTRGRILASAYEDYPLEYPRPEWIELDSRRLLATVKNLIKRVSNGSGDDPIQAICSSCQGEAVAAVDRHGNALSNFVVTFDNRTYPQYLFWQNEVGTERIYQITGMPLHPMYTINKVMWFAQNRPELHGQTWKYLCGEDYVSHYLTGETVMGYPLAARTMAFDLRAGNWSTELLTRAGVKPELLSQPAPSGAVVGTVRPQVAAELGLPAGVTVVAGGHDQACGALGAGAVDPGTAVNCTGTVDVLCTVLPPDILCNVDRVSEPGTSYESLLAGNYCCYPHTSPGAYLTLAFNFTGGQLLRWYRNVVASSEVEQAIRDGADPYSRIIESASSQPADVFWLPHFVGAGTPSLEAQSRGALLGLTLSTGRPELSRAVLDSLNYELKYNMESLEQSGVRIDHLRVGGGGARSARWLQMKADLFGIGLSVPQNPETSALGAAILAAVASGCFADVREAVANMVSIAEEYTPRRAEAAAYEERYQVYREIFASLRDINARIARLGREK